MEELSKFLDDFMSNYIKNRSGCKQLTEDELQTLKFEAKAEIEIACEQVLFKVDRFTSGENQKYGILI